MSCESSEGEAVWDFIDGGLLVAKGEDQQLRLGQHFSRRYLPGYFKISEG